LRKEVVDPDKIIIISYQHLDIRAVFERLYFGWQESTGEVVHRYCTQHIAQNIYKDCHMKRGKTQATRDKNPWRYEKYLKKINNIRLAYYKYKRKIRIIQENFLMNVASMPIEQMSNIRTRNNINRNNQTATVMPTEEVLAEKFHYEELTPDEVAALHQERWAQHLNRGLNR
jgi:hypothetical protein